MFSSKKYAYFPVYAYNGIRIEKNVEMFVSLEIVFPCDFKCQGGKPQKTLSK